MTLVVIILAHITLLNPPLRWGRPLSALAHQDSGPNKPSAGRTEGPPKVNLEVGPGAQSLKV